MIRHTGQVSSLRSGTNPSLFSSVTMSTHSRIRLKIGFANLFLEEIECFDADFRNGTSSRFLVSMFMPMILTAVVVLISAGQKLFSRCRKGGDTSSNLYRILQIANEKIADDLLEVITIKKQSCCCPRVACNVPLLVLCCLNVALLHFFISDHPQKFQCLKLS